MWWRTSTGTSIFECLKQHELAGATDTASSARQIFEQQLFGYDIDQSLVDICGFSLYLAARQVTRAELPTPNIKVLPSPSGSLALAPGGSTDTAQKETRLQVDHIVMNPPYQSTRTIDSATSDYIKTHYANASGDLYTAFIELALRLLKDGGTLSAITQQSFLSISRYRQFRLDLLERAEFIHYEILGPGVFYFCPGEKVNSIVFTLQKKPNH
ncbi:MAG: Eco57I restriction-modification methylase domain-containing protein [Candidatus Obscuribacter sp.]|nr:Eco57I restriction-modification methylase domain-containing protein [Candidatus Obscuribacter sp.]